MLSLATTAGAGGDSDSDEFAAAGYDDEDLEGKNHPFLLLLLSLFAYLN